MTANKIGRRDYSFFGGNRTTYISSAQNVDNNLGVKQHSSTLSYFVLKKVCLTFFFSHLGLFYLKHTAHKKWFWVKNEQNLLLNELFTLFNFFISNVTAAHGQCYVCFSLCGSVCLIYIAIALRQ